MISDERLEDVSNGDAAFLQDVEIAEMARELLAHRKAWREPVAWTLRFRNSEGKLDKRLNIMTTFDSLDKAQSYGKGGRFKYQADGSLKWVADASLDPQVIPLYLAPSFSD